MQAHKYSVFGSRQFSSISSFTAQLSSNYNTQDRFVYVANKFTCCFHKCKSGTTVCCKLPDTNKLNNFRVRQSNVFLNFKLSSRQTRNTPYWAMLLLLTLVINLRLPLFSITNVNGNYFRTRFHKYSESSCQMFSSKLRDLNYSILCN